MKTILFVFLFPFSVFAFENPYEPCAGMNCTPRLLEISAGFSAAGGIEASALPLLASGECYHMSESYDANTTHYGTFLLDQKDGQAYLGGSFAFFYSENPYRNWDLAKARAENSNLYADNHRAELTPEFAFADMNPGQSTLLLYWLKRTGKKIFVMGQWDVFHRLLCEMSVHEGAGGAAKR